MMNFEISETGDEALTAHLDFFKIGALPTFLRRISIFFSPDVTEVLLDTPVVTGEDGAGCDDFCASCSAGCVSLFNPS